MWHRHMMWASAAGNMVPLTAGSPQTFKFIKNTVSVKLSKVNAIKWGIPILPLLLLENVSWVMSYYCSVHTLMSMNFCSFKNLVSYAFNTLPFWSFFTQSNMNRNLHQK